MTERIHTNDNYGSVFMLEVLNEPVHAGDYPSEAADMIKNYYPAAWESIRAKEGELGIAEDNQLHIQLMVSDLTLKVGFKEETSDVDRPVWHEPMTSLLTYEP